MKKVILRLCTDVGSNSRGYAVDDAYGVVLVGSNIGVENFTPPNNVHGVIANPVCTEFSRAKQANNSGVGDHEEGMFLVNNCLRVIKECSPKFWTKKTALWGSFNIPELVYTRWGDVKKNPNLYIRPNRQKPSIAFTHKSAIDFSPEYAWYWDKVRTGYDFRGLCAVGFSSQLKEQIAEEML